MVPDRKQEVVLGAIICVFLLILMGSAIVYPVATQGVRSLAANTTQFFDLAAFVAIITFLDYPEKIRSSQYLRGQAEVLIWCLAVFGFAALFLPDLQKYASTSKVIIIATAGIFAFSTIAKMVHHYLSNRRLTDD